MRRVVALLAVLAAWASLPAAADAADRLDRVAAGLARSPLYVHPDLVWLLDDAEEKAVEAELRGLDPPLFVAVLPAIREDASGGDTHRMLVGIQERLGRDGAYAVVDQRGAMGFDSRNVARDFSVPLSLLLPGSEDGDPVRTVVERLTVLARIVRDAPPGEPDPPEGDPRPLTELYSSGPTLLGDSLVAGIVGGLLGLLVSGPIVAVRLMRRQRDAA